MNLIIPGVGTEPGPDYATDINNSLTLIDQHDHTSGYGVPITPAGLNINATLPLNNNLINNIKGAQLAVQPSASATNGTISVTGVDLYFTDYNGNQVRLTSGGAVAGTPGTISGLSAPASASYSGGIFTWASNGTIRADMDFRSAILRNNTAGSFGLTLSPPASLTADYTLVLPLKPASAASFLTIDTSGNITPSTALLGALTTSNLSTTAGILGSQIASSTITGSNIASTTIQGSNIVNSTITGTKIASDTILNANINTAAGINGSKLESNPTFNGTKIQIGNGSGLFAAKNHSSLSDPFRICRGKIASGGAAAGGEGFTSSFSSTGVYVVTFSPSFTSVPIVTATVVQPDATGTPVGYAISVKNITTTGFVVLIADATPTAVDSALNFLAIGL